MTGKIARLIDYWVPSQQYSWTMVGTGFITSGCTEIWVTFELPYKNHSLLTNGTINVVSYDLKWCPIGGSGVWGQGNVKSLITHQLTQKVDGVIYALTTCIKKSSQWIGINNWPVVAVGTMVFEVT